MWKGLLAAAALAACATDSTFSAQAPDKVDFARDVQPIFRQFLLGTQFADGSWFVKSRAIPLQPHFERGFPFGRDQFISAAGTNWAARALAVAYTKPS